MNQIFEWKSHFEKTYERKMTEKDAYLKEYIVYKKKNEKIICIEKLINNKIQANKIID